MLGDGGYIAPISVHRDYSCITRSIASQDGWICGGGVRRIAIGLNVAVAFFVVWLHVSGLVTGLTRMRFAPGEMYVPPTWLTASNGIMLAGSGALVLVFFVALLWTLMPLAFRR